MKIQDPAGRGLVEVYRESCALRPCLWVAENKGTYVQGRGYVSYHRTPWLECWERHERGCPDPLPPIDPERARCCAAPRFPPREPKGNRGQRCKACGTLLRGDVLRAARTLGVRP